MKCVLIVEDEPLIALDLRYACEDLDIDVVTATSSRQALEAIADHRFDGAVLDMNLGRGDTSEEVARVLKQRGVPFLLNTGDLNRTGEFLREFAVPIVTKPSAADYVISRLLELA